MSCYGGTMALCRDHYSPFGDPGAMPVKVIRDYTCCWGVRCRLLFQRSLTDLTKLSRLLFDSAA